MTDFTVLNSSGILCYSFWWTRKALFFLQSRYLFIP